MQPIKNCKICHNLFKPKTIKSIFCSRKCSLYSYNRSEKRKLVNKKYNKTKKCKDNQSKRSKILWQNIKLARKIKKLKFKNKKQIKHLEKFNKYLLKISRDQKKYRSNPEVLRRKKISDKKYYSKPKNKIKIKLYRKKYLKTKEGKAKMVARMNKRRALKINAIPKWCNLEKIKEIYKNCPKGYHVDHIIPLNNPIVCGLHVENNLQYLTARENISKGNKLIC